MERKTYLFLIFGTTAAFREEEEYANAEWCVFMSSVNIQTMTGSELFSDVLR